MIFAIRLQYVNWAVDHLPYFMVQSLFAYCTSYVFQEKSACTFGVEQDLALNKLCHSEQTSEGSFDQKWDKFFSFFFLRGRGRGGHQRGSNLSNKQKKGVACHLVLKTKAS